MFQIDNSTSVAAIPPPTSAGVPGFFTDGNPATGQAATLLPAEFMNMLMMENMNVLAAGGISPAKGQYNQLALAIAKIVSSTAARETVSGVVKLSTNPQVIAGTDDSTAVTPLKLSQKLGNYLYQATEAAFGWLKIATQTQTNNGLDDNTAVTPKKLGVTFQSQAFLAVTTTGTSTTYAIAPNYDAAPYAPNQRFCITFHIASTGSPTLNASGRGNRGLKQYDYSGAKVPATVSAGQVSDVIFDGTDFVVIDQLPQYFTQDLWALQPVGALIALIDNGTVPAPTQGSANYAYIKLTAGDVYNAGLITSESVSGTAPLVSATGVVSLAGSPFNGATVRLINTERRVIRAGAPGTIEADQFQGHSFGDPRLGAGYILTTPGNVNISYSTGADYGTVITRIDAATGGVQLSAKTDGANGTPRLGNETRVKSMGATYYMRIK